MPRQVTLARRLSPWWRRSRIPWATVLPLGAIVVLAVAAVNERRTVRKLVDGQALLLEDARRAMLMDDLLGTRVPSMRIETLQGETFDFRHEIAGSPTWILNPNACAGCLDHMPKWNRTAPDALGGNLVLVGVSRARAGAIVRDLGVRIPVYLDRDGDVLRLIRGYGFPSVHLVTSSDGTVLLVDGHSTHTNCEWSFPAVVSRLVALDEGDRPTSGPHPNNLIRAAPASLDEAAGH